MPHARLALLSARELQGLIVQQELLRHPHARDVVVGGLVPPLLLLLAALPVDVHVLHVLHHLGIFVHFLVSEVHVLISTSCRRRRRRRLRSLRSLRLRLGRLCRRLCRRLLPARSLDSEHPLARRRQVAFPAPGGGGRRGGGGRGGRVPQVPVELDLVPLGGLPHLVVVAALELLQFLALAPPRFLRFRLLPLLPPPPRRLERRGPFFTGGNCRNPNEIAS
mmetsp:Transcript_17179/g.54950  ORF Transcript_17179/g.54950 Transcript_17179/m.54950 type:complete len:221 (-) Transcript_17179:144-806(-)